MAKPSTRQGLIDYCLRQLGAPVLEINVDDDQIDDLVDDAIQYFNERHYDGVEKMYLKYKITEDDVNRGRAKNTGRTSTFKCASSTCIFCSTSVYIIFSYFVLKIHFFNAVIVTFVKILNSVIN